MKTQILMCLLKPKLLKRRIPVDDRHSFSVGLEAKSEVQRYIHTSGDGHPSHTGPKLLPLEPLGGNREEDDRRAGKYLVAIVDGETKRRIESRENQVDFLSPVSCGQRIRHPFFIAWHIETKRLKVFDVKVNRAGHKRSQRRP